MTLFEELAAYGIEVDEYMTLQSEFMDYCREKLESDGKKISYREFVERDKALNNMEKFINALERKRLQKKLEELSKQQPNPSSP